MSADLIEVELPRDHLGRPLIKAPGTHERTAYERPSSAGRCLTDESFIVAWQKRCCVVGLAENPEMLARFMACEGSKERNKIIEEAERLGGAKLKAARGTAFHTDCEHDQHGRPLVIEEHRPALESLYAAITDNDLTIVDGWAEAFLVNHDTNYAGSIDLLLTDGTDIFVADIKTGGLHHIEYAVQLYIYATMQRRYWHGSNDNGLFDSETPLPELSTSAAVILQVDLDKATTRLHWVDLEAGAEAFDLVQHVLEVREVKTISAFTAEPEIQEDPVAKVTKICDKAAKRDRRQIKAGELVDTDWRTWTKDRIDTLKADGHAATLAATWPEGVPTLKSGDPIWVYEGEQITAAINAVEKQTGAAFPALPPGHEAPPPRKVSARRSAPLEDETVTQADVDAVNAAAKRLTAAGRMWIDATLKQAHKAGRPLRLSGPSGAPTRRRWEIVSALLAIADSEDDGLCRALVSIAIGEEIPTTTPLGAALGDLTIDEGHTLGQLARAVRFGTLTPLWGEAGVTVEGDINAAITAA
jgi:hypothetical protein